MIPLTATRVVLARYVPLSATIVSTARRGAPVAEQPRADHRRPIGVQLLEAQAGVARAYW